MEIEPVNRQIADADRLHRMLINELSTAGCFRRSPVRSAVYGACILAVYGAAYATLLTAPGVGQRVVSIVLVAFVSVHAGFLAHEAGHGAITRNRRIAESIGQVFNTLLTGLCYSYFNHIHRQHHPHCNDRTRDPDMQSGVFSMYRQSALEKNSGLPQLISSNQGTLIWILVSLQGFTFKIDSVQHLRCNPRTTRIDQAVVLMHFSVWLVPPTILLGLADALLNYTLMTLFIGPYLGAIFLVNHIGTHVIEPGERLPFFLHEIAVTRNLGSTRLQDFLFGGLNNHIEHHLFPSMPTARLRAARRITREFCRRHGIGYLEMSWLTAAREVTCHFKAMSEFVPH